MENKKIFKNKTKILWKKYCSFLELDLVEYMKIQNELLLEQIKLWSSSKLGKNIIKNEKILTVDDFRKKVKITTYEDYADILLNKDEEALPKKPAMWIQTTWEGGTKPIKLAPYCEEMLEVFKDNIVSCLLLCTSNKKGKSKIKNNDKVLYGLAPLPFLTGLVPEMIKRTSDISFLPKVEDALELSFSQRNKLGFKMAMRDDVEIFFGLGSVASAITKTLINSENSSSSIKSLFKCKPYMIFRILKAKIKSKITKKPIKPKDLFKLKGFVVAGTDNKCYKEELTKDWNICPMELFAGTEPSLIGTETWSKNGMYFFPKTCFYEFIEIDDVLKNKIDNTHPLNTSLMNEVKQGEIYELVISVLNGGAFMRYRVGDLYKCIEIGNKEDGTLIPRFEYVDRIPWIIDIAGFSRFNENEINEVIKLSNIKVEEWMATKDYNNDNKPFLHLYLQVNDELKNEEEIFKLLDVNFSKIDEDYLGLKKIAGTDPLKVTIFTNNEITDYKNSNPNFQRVNSLDKHFK